MNTHLPADPVATQAALRAFFAQLAAGGVAHVAVSPGSRSTPLTIAADRTAGLDNTVFLPTKMTLGGAR